MDSETTPEPNAQQHENWFQNRQSDGRAKLLLSRKRPFVDHSTWRLGGSLVLPSIETTSTIMQQRRAERN
jgi:hypothetical protein